MRCSCLGDALKNGGNAVEFPRPQPFNRVPPLGIGAPQKLHGLRNLPRCRRIDTARAWLREDRKMDRLYYVIGLAAVTAAIFNVLGYW
jgi:hypothetical protein